MTTQDIYADKINKLLRKAETTTPEEAELLIEKAQELMTKYAIAEAMLDANRDHEKDEIEQMDLYYTGQFRDALMGLGYAVLNRNGCKGVYHDTDGWNEMEVDGKMYKYVYVLTVTGFRSDLERIRPLETSLRLQAMTAMQSWWKKDGKAQYGFHGSSYQKRARKSFLDGFTSTVAARLSAAQEAGTKAAAEEEAQRSGKSTAEASESVSLVLRSRKDRVQDWYDKKYGSSLRSVNRYRSQVGGGRQAGSAAGARADVGQPGVGGSRGALNS